MKQIYAFSTKAMTLGSVLLLLIGMSSLTVNAQSNFEDVQSIFQAKCISCHTGGGTYAGNLDLDLPENELYDAIVGTMPSNATAASNDDRIIDAGYPYRSFLIRKVNNGLIDHIDAPLDETSEGTLMPPPGSGFDPLTNIELETLRQWIYAGAPQTGAPVDMSVVENYYTNGGYEMIERPEPPAPDKGFQIHFGPIFMDTNDEKEYLKKHAIRNDEPIEVTRTDLLMNDQSHHFIMYKHGSVAAANDTDEGLREVTLFGENPFFINNDLVTTWTFSTDFRLPAGTAYFWDADTHLDLNYHIPNYSDDNILPADVYINVYTQPAGTAIKEMKSELLLYDPLSLIIPPGEHTFIDNINNGQQWNLWWLSSHTHKLGTDFDIYLQSTGEQLYEGHFDYTGCNCDVGYYDWSHPPVNLFEPLYELPAGTGMIQEATFDNTGNSQVTFGLTTNNEMLITVLQYTTGEPLPFVGIPYLQDSYCIGASSLEFEPAGGTIAGPGTSGTTFNPALAGIGTHEISYEYDGIVANYSITIVDGPVPTIDYEAQQMELSAEIGYDSYQWYLDGEAISDAVGPFHTPTTTGSYTVAVSSGNCSGTSEALSVVISGVNDVVNQYELSAFPNPYQSQTQISYTLANTSTVSLEVLNVLGQQVHTLASDKQNAGIYNYQFNHEELGWAAGIYFVNLTVDGQAYSQKIVAQ